MPSCGHQVGAGYAEKADLKDDRQKVVRSAVVMANELKAKGILVFTRHGYMARFTSWLRPAYSPIFAFTNSERVRNQLNLLWGVTPFVIGFSDDPETTILGAQRVLVERNLLAKDDQVVIISDVLARGKLISTVQMRQVE